MKASTEIGFLDQPQPVHGTMRFYWGTEEGIKECSVWQSTPVLGTIPTHTLPPPRCYLGHFVGFVTYSLVAIEWIAFSVANIFYCWFVVAWGCHDSDKTFLLLEKVTYKCIWWEKTIWNLVDWIKMTSRDITITTHVVFLGLLYVVVETWNNLQGSLFYYR